MSDQPESADENPEQQKEGKLAFAAVESAPEPFETRVMNWVLFGRDGLRAGWSIALFVTAFFVFLSVGGFFAILISGHGVQEQVASLAHGLSARMLMAQEGISVFGLLGAGLVMALIEKRRLGDYNLADRRFPAHIVAGLVGGFLALSGLVLALRAGGWIGFGQRAPSGFVVVGNALTWGAGFLLVALFEEGAFRCYLLRTFHRGFGGGDWGWWAAALVSSAMFGSIHFSNHGEGWIGVGAAAGIGVVFCCSVRWTGSAWWAIGFHAAWDWTQTFFYGTADSGIVPTGHWLSTQPAGNPLWSGGATGPEGSLAIVPLLVLVLITLFLGYGWRQRRDSAF
uniref:Putative Abortive infection protein n=1 Tax=mine drainage metagenome TaxID=410659 RepID=E6QIN6_9ZZZZ